MSSEIRRLDLDFKPRQYQAEIYKNMKRFNVLVCHRRFGKTILCEKDLADRGLTIPRRRPQLAYIAPTYRQAKLVAWEYFKHTLMRFPGATAHEQELRIDVPRPNFGDFFRVMLLGADNPDALRGLYLDWGVLDEYAQCNPALWGEVVRPALSDRLGGATFIGTPKGQNHFHMMHLNANRLMRRPNATWYSAVYKASQTKVIPADELAEARLTMSEEEYLQEYECDFTVAVRGAYYGELLRILENENRLCEVPHDPAAQVFTAWDLGMDDHTAIWFIQIAGREIHVIDYYANTGKGLEHYVKELNSKPYVYGRHYLPHDIEVRELSTGKTRRRKLETLGIKNITVVPRTTDIGHGIECTRTLIPRMWFDAAKTEEGYIGLKNYQKEWDAKLQTFKKTPKHDWTTHPADALRTFSEGFAPSHMGNYSGIIDLQRYRRSRAAEQSSVYGF